MLKERVRMNKGILVVSFGSTYKETREKNIGGIETLIHHRYPDMKLYRAFTSEIIIKVLKQRDSIEIMDVEQALQQMKKDGITHVYVQPTHIIDGIENHKAYETVQQWKNEFEYIGMAKPLLGDQEDYRKVVEAIWDNLKEGVKNNALILMGHGSDHKANISYEYLEDAFHKAGHTNVHLATVEAEPTIEDVIMKMEPIEYQRVILMPFMIVAGDHAHNDMAGETDSFCTKLVEKGYETNVVMKGLGEYKEIRDIFVSHLKHLIEEV